TTGSHDQHGVWLDAAVHVEADIGRRGVAAGALAAHAKRRASESFVAVDRPKLMTEHAVRATGLHHYIVQDRDRDRTAAVEDFCRNGHGSSSLQNHESVARGDESRSRFSG